jgi:hypothetical protein
MFEPYSSAGRKYHRKALERDRDRNGAVERLRTGLRPPA